MDISKIIIPAAGIGSRFLPITKSIPKEMLPLSNKPAIEYIVQEAVNAHLHDVMIVLSANKTVIIDYFSHNHNLEKILAEQDKSYYLAELNALIDSANFQYFIQNKPLGLANALLHAQASIDENEFFAVALPDDIILPTDSYKTPEIAHLMDIAKQTNGMVIGVQEVPQHLVSSYGIVSCKKQISQDCFEISSLVEKPSLESAPSNLAIVGRYIFHQKLFQYIPQTPPVRGEILLPDTINLMIQQGFPVYAYKIQGKRFDTGTPRGWLDFILHEAQ